MCTFKSLSTLLWQPEKAIHAFETDCREKLAYDLPHYLQHYQLPLLGKVI